MTLDTNDIVYEDQLPELTDEQYDIWFDSSWVDGVRVGYKPIFDNTL